MVTCCTWFPALNGLHWKASGSRRLASVALRHCFSCIFTMYFVLQCLVLERRPACEAWLKLLCLLSCSQEPWLSGVITGKAARLSYRSDPRAVFNKPYSSGRKSFFCSFLKSWLQAGQEFRLRTDSKIWSACHLNWFNDPDLWPHLTKFQNSPSGHASACLSWGWPQQTLDCLVNHRPSICFL